MTILVGLCVYLDWLCDIPYSQESLQKMPFYHSLVDESRGTHLGSNHLASIQKFLQLPNQCFWRRTARKKGRCRRCTRTGGRGGWFHKYGWLTNGTRRTMEDLIFCSFCSKKNYDEVCGKLLGLSGECCCSGGFRT